MAAQPPAPRSTAKADARLERSSLLDATDRRILTILADDGRISMRALAERVGVSRASAYSRVERLRGAGLISGFTVKLDPQALGLQVAALVIVTLQQTTWSEALEQFRQMPEIAYCAVTAAEFDAVLIIRAPDVRAIREVVLERLQSMPSVRRTRTMLILDEFEASDAALISAFADPNERA